MLGNDSREQRFFFVVFTPITSEQTRETQRQGLLQLQ